MHFNFVNAAIDEPYLTRFTGVKPQAVQDLSPLIRPRGFKCVSIKSDSFVHPIETTTDSFFE